jgi:hypothetical protein
LTGLANGKDTVIALEAEVEELTASIWNFQLHNLSGELLGYQTKMNQLKAQETLIRAAANEARGLSDLKKRAESLTDEVSSTAKDIEDHREAIHEALAAIGDVLKESTETQQKVFAIAALVQQNEIATTQQLSNATQSTANVQTVEKAVREASAEITSARTRLTELLAEAERLISSTATTTQVETQSLKTNFDEFKSGAEKKFAEVTAQMDKQVNEFTVTMTQKLEATSASAAKVSGDLEGRISQLGVETSTRLQQNESTQQIRLEGQLGDFNATYQNLLNSSKETITSALKGFEANAEEVRESQVRQFEKRVQELDVLEARIAKSIERATGYSLFHSFQKRQLDIEKEKRFWSRALGGMVLVSLLASGVFIWSLRFVTVYNAAFYLKLSISIPIIYAIAFCNVQYSRERRLEEEYAFKSNISISLDPYLKLVRELVDANKPEELAKYTAFIIESVNKVFTSPTKVIFDDQAADISTSQKLMKSVGDLIEPLIKALKK